MKGIEYVVDEKGERKAVMLDLNLYGSAVEEFLEDLYGHRVIQSRKKDKKFSKKEFLTGLKDDGLLRTDLS
jgi:hypothetical protein